jgi:hypothetical protein
MRVLLLFAALALMGLLLVLGLDDSARRALPERAEAPESEVERTGPPEEAGTVPRDDPERAAASEDQDTPPKPKPRSAYEGVVHGPDGPLWGAVVRAYRPDGTPCGTAQSRFEGRFKLEIPGDDAVTLEIDPRGSVAPVGVPRLVQGLIPQRRVGCAPGTVHEFHLRGGGTVTGTLERTDRKAVPRVNLIATPRDAGEDPLARRRCRVANDATFVLRGLEERDYELIVDDPFWMLRGPLRFHADARTVSGVLVPAVTLHITCLDIETAEPVDPALALLPDGLVAHGSKGDLRVRFPLPHGMERPVRVEIRAPGYVPREVQADSDDPLRVYLHREREPNVIFSVVYEDGRPAHARGLWVLFDPEGRPEQSEMTPFRRLPDGRFKGTLPAGKWELSLLGEPEIDVSLEVRVPPSGILEQTVVVERGGDLVLIRGAREGSIAVTVQALPNGRRFDVLVSEERALIRDLEPGHYGIHWYPGPDGETASRDVEIERDRKVVVDLSRP